MRANGTEYGLREGRGDVDAAYGREEMSLAQQLPREQMAYLPTRSKLVAMPLTAAKKAPKEVKRKPRKVHCRRP